MHDDRQAGVDNPHHLSGLKIILFRAHGHEHRIAVESLVQDDASGWRRACTTCSQADGVSRAIGCCCLGDPSRAIPVADPAGRDWRLSHGAHLEGLALALAARGARLSSIEKPTTGPTTDGLVAIAECAVAQDTEPSSQEPVQTRMSWRGAFKPVDAETKAELARLAAARRLQAGDRSLQHR
jgi:hypothetical protein